MLAAPDPLNPCGSAADGAAGADARLAALRGRGIRLGTRTVREVLVRLGDPQHQAPTVLVAGTNGKGSTTSLIAAAATAAGYRTGSFTSPALATACEQVLVDGRPLADRDLASCLDETIRLAERLRPGEITAFEALSVAAFTLFRRQDVDLAVVEVGLGGARDATNVANPQVAVLTSVAADHRDSLGRDVAAVAREKAGIARRGRPLVVGWLGPEARQAVAAEAARRGARPRYASGEVRDLTSNRQGFDRQRVRFTTDRAAYDLDLALLGDHQARNLALATLAIEALAAAGFPRLEAGALARGVASCRWPGRLESFRLPCGSRVLVDGAHNASSAQALGVFLRQLAMPYRLVFGALRDKDAGAMLASLAPAAERVFLASVDDARSWQPQPGAASTRRGDAFCATIADALDAARKAVTAAALHGEPPSVILACGSLRVVAESHAWLGAQGLRSVARTARGGVDAS